VASFVPKGVCATRIDFEIDTDGLVHDVRFLQGCPGNAAGVSRLAEGRPATELIELLSGLPCGPNPTSCPAQFALALSEELEKRSS
jgi:uncharacterized protein (TIGR03905 family)